MSWAKYDFEAAYQRVLEAAGVGSQLALANVLGVKQSSVWDAVRRKRIPASWLVTLVELYGISPRWIKTGMGEQFLTRALADMRQEELMAELGRRQDDMYKRCAGSGVTPAAEG